MLPVAGIAATASGAVGEEAAGFTLTYVFARLILMGLWARAGRYNPLVRPVTNLYLLGFGLSIALWSLSVFVPPVAGVLLRGLGLIIEITTPILTLGHQARIFRASVGKLPERMGLFVIIVLGEVIISIINGVGEMRSLDLGLVLRFVAGLLLGFLLWWNYFDSVGRREPISGAGRTWPLARWIYLHLPLLMGIAVIGTMLEYAVAAPSPGSEEGHGMSQAAVGWILSGAFAMIYGSLAVLESTLELEKTPVLSVSLTVWMRLATAVAALTLPLLSMTPLGIALGLVFLQAINGVMGARAWFASDYAGRPDVH